MLWVWKVLFGGQGRANRLINCFDPDPPVCSNVHMSISLPSNGLLLLQVVKGPVTKYFPPNCQRVGFSHSAPSIVTLREFVDKLPNDVPAVFVVGAMAHGKVEVTYVDQMVSISEYPLSAACCLGRITNSFEWKWGIV